MTRLVHLAVTATAVLGLAACSSDSKSTSSKGSDAATPTVEVSAPDITVPEITIPDITIPDLSIPDFSIPDLSIPDLSIPEMSEQCMAFYKTFAGALAGQGETGDLSGFFDQLQNAVPADLKDDAALIGSAMSTYLTIMQQYGGDITKVMADPAAQQALQALSTPEFEAASNNISAYMDSICPQS